MPFTIQRFDRFDLDINKPVFVDVPVPTLEEIGGSFRQEEEYLEIEGQLIRFDLRDIDEDTRTALALLTPQIFARTRELADYAFQRCTWFGEYGYLALAEILKNKTYSRFFTDPRVEGCDSNPYDQHYWIACNISGINAADSTLIIDPIFKYIGLQSHNDNNYYKNKRKVNPVHGHSDSIRQKIHGI